MEHQYTKKDKFLNWLYYHVWWLVAAGFLLIVGGSMIFAGMEQAGKGCDYCIAYIGTVELPAACVSALQEEIAVLGRDTNGDEEVIVQIKQYIVSDVGSQDTEAAYGRVAEVALLTDISEGESYFFLVEYPEEFQKDFQLMAHMDGSTSADDDFGVWDKVYRWADCPVLAGLELGTSVDSAGVRMVHQELLADLYLGRRCFLNPNMKINSAANADLWEALTENAIPAQGAN